jgi:hypothetical protein
MNHPNWFHNSMTVTILFEFWKIQGVIGYLFSLVVVFILTIINQFASFLAFKKHESCEFHEKLLVHFSFLVSIYDILSFWSNQVL